MTTEQARQLIPEKSYIGFAGSKYKVADLSERFSVLFIGIYDEPPSLHVDYLKADSCEWLGESSPPTAIREEGSTPASREEEIIDKYLSNWLKNVSVEHEAEVKAVRGQIVAAMQEYSQAKEKEIEELKNQIDIRKNIINEQISELKYWKELAKAAESMIGKMIFDNRDRETEDDDLSEYLSYQEKWQALKNQKPNSEQEVKGSDTTKLNSSTSDGK